MTFFKIMIIQMVGEKERETKKQITKARKKKSEKENNAKRFAHLYN